MLGASPCPPRPPSLGKGLPRTPRLRGVLGWERVAGTARAGCELPMGPACAVPGLRRAPQGGRGGRARSPGRPRSPWEGGRVKCLRTAFSVGKAPREPQAARAPRPGPAPGRGQGPAGRGLCWQPRAAVALPGPNPPAAVPPSPPTFRFTYFALFIQHVQNIQHRTIISQ